MNHGHSSFRVIARCCAWLSISGILLLSACGGGGGSSSASDATKSILSEIPSADTIFIPGINAPIESAKVASIQLLSEKRISRTIYEYVYSVTVRNGNAPRKATAFALLVAPTNSVAVSPFNNTVLIAWPNAVQEPVPARDFLK